jgi:hypothetical protein
MTYNLLLLTVPDPPLLSDYNYIWVGFIYTAASHTISRVSIIMTCVFFLFIRLYFPDHVGL